VVPVIARYSEELFALAEQAGANSLLRGSPPPVPGHVVSWATSVLNRRLHATHPELDVTPTKLRWAWLAEHLSRGTPLRALLQIAGLKTLTSIEMLLRFFPPPPDDPRALAMLFGAIEAESVVPSHRD
jgi:hypothetical protein